MPDVYLSRAGMETQQLDEKFTQTELSSVKNDLAQIELAARITDDRGRQLEDSLRRLRKNMDTVSEVLSLNPPAELVRAALRRIYQSLHDPIRSHRT